MKKLLLLITVVCCLFACGSKPSVEQSFVKQQNGQLMIGDKPYYYIGTNMWYAAILGSTGKGGNRERLLKELDFLQNIGINNLRILVGADGTDGTPFRVMPNLQEEPGMYNDTIFDGLDFLLAEMGKRSMYAVLYLNNSWEWSGGYSKYLYWTGHGKEPIPSIDGWDPFINYIGQYAECDSCKELFFNHIRYVLGRTNKYTGKKYTEEPAIMAWQVANEPRAFSNEAKPAFVKWLREATALIKSLDNNHLVTLGSEGEAGCEDDLALFEEIHSDPNVDYLTIHIWPKNWGWLDTENIPATLDSSIEKTNSYINRHLAVGTKLNKPVVMEEFGLPRDHHKYTLDDPTSLRDIYYKNAFDQVLEASRNKGIFAGCNFWAWGGFGQPVHEYWQAWDDYVGDSGHDEQGLNSVFATDSTIDLIKSYTDKLNNGK